MFQIWKRNRRSPENYCICARDRRGWPRRISRQKFPKKTRILSIPSKPHSFHSVNSSIGSRINGMIFRSFRKRNSSQKNTNTALAKCKHVPKWGVSLYLLDSYNPYKRYRTYRSYRTHSQIPSIPSIPIPE